MSEQESRSYKNGVPQQLPLDGTYVWFHENGAAWRTKTGAVVNFVKLGPPVERLGYEESLPSGKSLGMPDMQRGHAVGPELGVESPFGITFEHKTVNQHNPNGSSKRDFELMLKRLQQQKTQDCDVYLISETYVWPSNPENYDGACLRQQNYEVFVRQRSKGEIERSLQSSFTDVREMKKASHRIYSFSVEIGGRPNQPKIVIHSKNHATHPEIAREYIHKKDIRRGKRIRNRIQTKQMKSKSKIF